MEAWFCRTNLVLSAKETADLQPILSRALTSFLAHKTTEFDPLVGDYACHVRAMLLTEAWSNPQILHFLSSFPLPSGAAARPNLDLGTFIPLLSPLIKLFAIQKLIHQYYVTSSSASSQASSSSYSTIPIGVVVIGTSWALTVSKSGNDVKRQQTDWQQFNKQCLPAALHMKRSPADMLINWMKEKLSFWTTEYVLHVAAQHSTSTKLLEAKRIGLVWVLPTFPTFAVLLERAHRLDVQFQIRFQNPLRVTIELCTKHRHERDVYVRCDAAAMDVFKGDLERHTQALQQYTFETMVLAAAALHPQYLDGKNVYEEPFIQSCPSVQEWRNRAQTLLLHAGPGGLGNIFHVYVAQN